MTTKIMIDPGHGGKDPGAVGYGLQEKVLTLDIAQRIRRILETEYTGVQVRLTRESDTYLDLSDRARMANDWGADYFVSVHINAGGGTGFESFIHTSQDSRTAALRNVVHDENMRMLSSVRDRGKKAANFAVLRETRMPAVLTENLFIDHPEDARKLKDSAFLEKVARGHVEGIARAFELKKKAQPKTSQPKTESGVFYRVVTGSFRDRANAEKRQAELKKAGFDSFIELKHR